MSKEGRERTRELREAQQAAAQQAARRRRILAIIGLVVILGLVVAIVFVVIRAAGGDAQNTAGPTGPVSDPANLTSTGAIPVGDDSAPVTVTIYFDYMCPVCGAFEAANSDELTRLIDEGTAKIELRPLAFLDRMSNGTKYSTRAANAIATVADGAPDAVWAFHTALYDNQPKENSDGLSDDKIAEIATDSGVPADVVKRFAEGNFEQWVAQSTQKAFDSEGVTGTPTVLINGEVFKGDLFHKGPLTDAIEKAAGG